jgi:hypothetical protein
VRRRTEGAHVSDEDALTAFSDGRGVFDVDLHSRKLDALRLSFRLRRENSVSGNCVSAVAGTPTRSPTSGGFRPAVESRRRWSPSATLRAYARPSCSANAAGIASKPLASPTRNRPDIPCRSCRADAFWSRRPCGSGGQLAHERAGGRAGTRATRTWSAETRARERQASDCGLLRPDLAVCIRRRVKGIEIIAVRLENSLTPEQ